MKRIKFAHFHTYVKFIFNVYNTCVYKVLRNTNFNVNSMISESNVVEEGVGEGGDIDRTKDLYSAHQYFMYIKLRIVYYLAVCK